MLHKLSLLAAGLLFLGACTDQDIEPTPNPEPTDAKIIVSGGTPNTQQSTRAEEPAVAGVCSANELKLMFYYNQTTLWYANFAGCPNDDWSKVSLIGTANNIPLAITNGNENKGTDRLTSYNYHYTAPKSTSDYRKILGIYGIAYSKEEYAENITENNLSTGAAGNVFNIELKPGKVQTPEIYFGRLTGNFGKYELEKSNCGLNCIDLSKIEALDLNVPVSGRIYRIVSQLNVNIEILKKGVKKVELVMSRLPRKLNMCGSHGAFYPVTAVTSASDCLNDVTVASADVKPGETAKLSTFIFPSEVGYTLALRVIKNDNSTETIPVQPTADVKWSDASDVYSLGSGLKDADKNILIYKKDGNLFYSYSNIRVNLNGSYSEQSTINAEIHVESSFEKQHTYPDIHS